MAERIFWACTVLIIARWRSVSTNLVTDHVVRSVVDVQQSSHENYFVRSKGDEIEWTVHCNGNLPSTVSWLDNHGRKIPWQSSEDLDWKYNATRLGRSVKLRIRNLTVEDSGNYTVHIGNRVHISPPILRLFVEDLPITKFSMPILRVRRGKPASISCEITSYPYSNIVVTFTPCHSKHSCHIEARRSLKSVVQSKVRQTVSVNFVPNSSGFVTCMARNSKGLNRTIAEVVIIELEDMYITSERHSLGERQFVDSMECSVNKRKFYEELNWYKDGKFVDRLAYPGVNMGVIKWGDRYGKMLDSPWGAYKEPGKYVCRARLRRDNSTIEKVWWVNRTQSLEPESHLAEGASFTLECRIGEEAPTEIHWFKNGGCRIDVDRNSADIEFLENNRILHISNVKMEHEGQYICLVTNRFGETIIARWLKVSHS